VTMVLAAVMAAALAVRVAPSQGPGSRFQGTGPGHRARAQGQGTGPGSSVQGTGHRAQGQGPGSECGEGMSEHLHCTLLRKTRNKVQYKASRWVGERACTRVCVYSWQEQGLARTREGWV
jgi:hypothetical protein